MLFSSRGHSSVFAHVVPFSLAAICMICCLAEVAADPPVGYYNSVDETNSATLRATLHEVIDDHTRFTYTASSTDTWDILDLACEDPNDSNNILDVYQNASNPKAAGQNSNYNREHTWPKSYGFPKNVVANYPYTDCHHLFLCDKSYNSSRGRRLYRTCSAACDEKPTDANNGQGGGTGVYPGNSNWGDGPQNNISGTWETWIGRRGDVARALLYLDVRYEGGTHGVTGISEPDLILTNDELLIDASNTGANESVAYMGMLSVLLQWHFQDPVDAFEHAHNDVVFSFQGNRNPFVDHPEWVDCIFIGVNCGGGGDMTPPAAPTNLSATAGDGVVNLDWDDNTEPDLAGYNVQRSTTSGGPYSEIASLIAVSDFSDTGLTNGTTYYYVVRAEDTSANESGNSNEASATPAVGSMPSNPWINEFHYDNSNSDVGEFVEIAGPADQDLSGWSVIGYNGNGGGSYKTVDLEGTIPDQGGCMGTLSFVFTGMQNDMDGLALVAPGDTVIEFISYEGSFSATDGPANGMTSVDIGVDEDPAPAIGNSLQLSGTGSQASDFIWNGPAAETPGQPNTGQTFDGCGGITDCNNNGIDDAEDISMGTSQDCDGNGVPDECQTDTDGDGLIDPCDGCPNDPAKTSPGQCGCGVPDTGTDTDEDGVVDCIDNCVNTPNAGQEDCDNDGVGDACAGEPDCNSNGIPDSCDISSGTSQDTNSNGVPDECEAGSSTMHVDAIDLHTVNAGQGQKHGEAFVTVLDNLGNPVSGADVTGTFTGDFNETLMGTTNASGVATLTTIGTKKGSINAMFCVDDVVDGTLTYDADDNVITCDSL